MNKCIHIYDRIALCLLGSLGDALWEGRQPLNGSGDAIGEVLPGDSGGATGERC